MLLRTISIKHFTYCKPTYTYIYLAIFLFLFNLKYPFELFHEIYQQTSPQNCSLQMVNLVILSPNIILDN